MSTVVQKKVHPFAAARKAAELKKDSTRYEARVPWVLYHAKRYAQAKKAYQQLLQKYDADHSSEEIRDVVRESRMILSNIAIHLEMH